MRAIGFRRSAFVEEVLSECFCGRLLVKGFPGGGYCSGVLFGVFCRGASNPEARNIFNHIQLISLTKTNANCIAYIVDLINVC